MDFCLAGLFLSLFPPDRKRAGGQENKKRRRKICVRVRQLSQVRKEGKRERMGSGGAKEKDKKRRDGQTEGGDGRWGE